LASFFFLGGISKPSFSRVSRKEDFPLIGVRVLSFLFLPPCESKVAFSSYPGTTFSPPPHGKVVISFPEVFPWKNLLPPPLFSFHSTTCLVFFFFFFLSTYSVSLAIVPLSRLPGFSAFYPLSLTIFFFFSLFSLSLFLRTLFPSLCLPSAPPSPCPLNRGFFFSPSPPLFSGQPGSCGGPLWMVVCVFLRCESSVPPPGRGPPPFSQDGCVFPQNPQAPFLFSWSYRVHRSPFLEALPRAPFSFRIK